MLSFQLVTWYKRTREMEKPEFGPNSAKQLYFYDAEQAAPV